MTLLSQTQGKFLVKLARNAITAHLDHKDFPIPSHDALLDEPRGVFCTLKTVHDVLRGCIGFPYPDHPLVEAVTDAAISAAIRDTRFKPVELQELHNIKIEVTVLTPPEELTGSHKDFPNKVEIGRHGLIAKKGLSSGLLLPQVAVEDVRMSPVEFLDATCWKAGLPPQSWKEKETKIFTFEGQIFKED